MKQHLLTSLGLLTSLAFQERLIADIAIDPSEIVPADVQPDSQAQTWTAIAGTGLLLGAGIAVLMVRIRNARQRTSKNGTGTSGTTGKTDQ